MNIEFLGKEFRFLGSSNSQLRNNGCYFFEGTQEEIGKIRRDLGQFKMYLTFTRRKLIII